MIPTLSKEGGSHYMQALLCYWAPCWVWVWKYGGGRLIRALYSRMERNLRFLVENQGDRSQGSEYYRKSQCRKRGPREKYWKVTISFLQWVEEFELWTHFLSHVISFCIKKRCFHYFVYSVKEKHYICSWILKMFIFKRFFKSK